VVGVFNSVQDAHEAVRHLEQQGFSRDEISLVANKNARGFEHMSDEDKSAIKDKTSDVIADAGIGAAIGGVGGLLLSIAGVAVPGIGPILVAGPIAAALTGAGIGAAGGGIIGALTESGIPEEHAHYYSESVRRGDVMLMVRATGDRAERAADILDEHGAVDVDERVRNWQNRGWKGRYDEGAEPYTRDQLESERSYYESTMSGTTGYMDDNPHMARTETAGTGTSRTGLSQEEGWRDRDTDEHIDGGLSSLGGVPGLGRDSMGREVAPGKDISRQNLREGTHVEPADAAAGHRNLQDDFDAGRAGSRDPREVQNTGPGAYSQDIDYEYDRRDREHVRENWAEAKRDLREHADDVTPAEAYNPRAAHGTRGTSDRPGVGDDIERGWENIKRGASKLYRKRD
jgi:hypothetical protein